MKLNGTMITEPGRKFEFNFISEHLNKPIITRVIPNDLIGCYEYITNINAALLIDGKKLKCNKTNFDNMFYDSYGSILSVEFSTEELIELGDYFKNVVFGDFYNLDKAINKHYFNNEKDIRDFSNLTIGQKMSKALNDYLYYTSYDFKTLITDIYEFSNLTYGGNRDNKIYDRIRSFIIDRLEKELDLDL